LVTYKKLQPTTRYCIDSSYVKNRFGQECIGRNHTDRGRKALKLSAIVDQHGMPHGLACHPGNKPDVVLFEPCLKSMLTQLESVPMYAYRGYDSRHNRSVCASHGLHNRRHLPARRFRCADARVVRVRKWRRNAEQSRWQLHKQRRNEGRRVDFTSEGFTAARAKRVESIGTEITMLQST
jgi:hypothetical protein